MRGAGDRGGSFGLGLAIVKAVAESHGGSVTLESPAERTTRRAAAGARFVVRLPTAGGDAGGNTPGESAGRASDLDDDGQHHRPALEAVVD